MITTVTQILTSQDMVHTALETLTSLMTLILISTDRALTDQIQTTEYMLLEAVCYISSIMVTRIRTDMKQVGIPTAQCMTLILHQPCSLT